MFLLSDVITYIRRIIKSPSNQAISDNLLIDYINRFYISDMDARLQLFDLKKEYSFQTTPGVDKYNMPLYDVQIEGTSPPGAQSINLYPVYQGFLGPAYVNGVQVAFQTQKQIFYNAFPKIVQNLQIVDIGIGITGPYNFTTPIVGLNSTPLNPPIMGLLRGHIDTSGIIARGTTNVDPPLVSSFDTTIPVTSVESAVYITATNSDGSNINVQDSGQFLDNTHSNYGLLMAPGNAPLGNSVPGPSSTSTYFGSFSITGATQATQAVLTVTSTVLAGELIEISGVGGMTQLNGGTFEVVSNTGTLVTIDVDSTGFGAYTAGGTLTVYRNVINYLTGQVKNLYFPISVPSGSNINMQCYIFQSGLPRAILFNNNTLTLRSPPDRQYLVKLDAYLSPAAFLNSTAALPFGYMAEYITRGAARKILSDTGDVEQFQFYEPLFREQELLVWKRSQRQWTATRTETIYSQGYGNGSGMGTNNYGGF